MDIGPAEKIVKIPEPVRVPDTIPPLPVRVPVPA